MIFVIVGLSVFISFIVALLFVGWIACGIWKLFHHHEITSYYDPTDLGGVLTLGVLYGAIPAAGVAFCYLLGRLIVGIL